MVLLGGLEIVAAGYLINKHQKNKRERERIEDERLALEEQYHLLPPNDPRSGRRHRSHSESHHERRDSRNSRHSRHRKQRQESPNSRPDSTSPTPPRYHKSHSTSPRPRPVQPVAHPMLKPALKPTASSRPAAYPSPQPGPSSRPPTHPSPQPYAQQPYPQHASQYPQDIKYGWADNPSPQKPSMQSHPPTGWPAHWEQSGRPENNGSSSRSPYPITESSRGRAELRPYDTGSRVRFTEDRDRSESPPPSYRP